MYEYIKALHLIFVISWFVGLFYGVRLFVYLSEAHNKQEPDKTIILNQLKIMNYRLWYIIAWPSAVLAIIFALWLLILMPAWLQMPWMQVKLGFVVLLFAYHIKCHQIFIKFQNNECPYSSNFLRLWNEGATIILFAIVFLVILKNAFNWIYGVIGIFVFSILIMLGFKFYKKIREKSNH